MQYGRMWHSVARRRYMYVRINLRHGAVCCCVVRLGAVASSEGGGTLMECEAASSELPRSVSIPGTGSDPSVSV